MSVSTVATIHGIGTTAARPAATAVPVGTLYLNTTVGYIQRSDGAAWVDWIPAATVTVREQDGSPSVAGVTTIEFATGTTVADQTGGVVRVTPPSGGGGSLTTASTALASDQALAAATWTDVLSLSLAAGTWLVWASIHISSSVGAVHTAARVTDGTTDYASASSTTSGAGHYEQLAMISEPIVLAATTTIKLRGFTDLAGTARATTVTGGSVVKATHMRALKVA